MIERASSTMFTPVQIKRAKRWIMAAEVPAGIAWSAIGLPYLTGFFLLFKASNFQISLISAIPAVGSVAAVFGVFLIERLKGKRPFIVAALASFYLAHALIGSIPFVFGGWSLQVQILIGLLLLAVAYAIIKIQDVFWYPLVSDIVPEGQRGRFFGILIVISTLVNVPLSLLIGRYLDAHNTLTHFGMVFLAAGSIGSLAGFFYLKALDVPNQPVGGTDFFLRRLLNPFLDRQFRTFLGFVLFATLAGSLCGPFTNVFMIESLRIPYLHIAGFNVIYSATYVIFLGVWGFIIDKYGNKAVLLICATPLAVIQWLWIFNVPEHYGLIALIYFLNGIMTAGSLVAINNLLMGISTGTSSASYLAAYQVVTGLVGFLAPVLGSALVQALRDTQVHLLGFDWGPYHFLFATAGGLLIFPPFFIAGIHESKGRGAWFVLRNMVLANPVRLALNLFSYHRSVTEGDRIAATTRLGETGNPMALSELVSALDDPVYFVRREAALALGRIRDREAVQPLIQKLSDEHASIQHEAAWALGAIKDDACLQPLMDCLKSSDRRLRGYAALALGELGASAAIEPLLAMLESSSDVFETTCAANALSQLGYRKALWKTLEKLVASNEAVVRRQLSVSLGDLLGQRGTFYQLLNREEKVYGESVEQMLDEMGRNIHRFWKKKLGESDVQAIRSGFKEVYRLYLDGQYADALRKVVQVCDQLFGPEMHHYNYTQEIGRKFLHELLDQNQATGNQVYWEECLLSIYELDLIVRSTEV